LVPFSTAIYSPEHPDKNWSLINVINQKNLRPQDKPRLLKELDKNGRDLIASYYPQIM
jgi:hypothetical protein